jgi:hypothetical protein
MVAKVQELALLNPVLLPQAMQAESKEEVKE